MIILRFVAFASVVVNAAAARHLIGIRWQSQIEHVPPEIIRIEGAIGIKKLKDSGGREPKKSAWQNFWGIVCVGYFILYKDDPAKLRKVSIYVYNDVFYNRSSHRRFQQKSDKVYPTYVIRLNSLTVEFASKEQAKRKNVIALSLDDGAQWLFQPQNEGDVNGWMDTVKEASKDRSTATEVCLSRSIFTPDVFQDVLTIRLIT